MHFFVQCRLTSTATCSEDVHHVLVPAQRSARHAPLVAPAAADRTGPPLSQGFLFTMVATVAGDHCSPEILDALSRIDPDAWYHGQLLEPYNCHFEEGAIVGLLEAFEARNVRIEHGPCRRADAPFCVFDARWEE